MRRRYQLLLPRPLLATRWLATTAHHGVPSTSKTKRRSRDASSETARALAALRVFRKTHGHAVVAPRFVVPTNDPTEWPRELHGLKLGGMVQRLYETAQRPAYDALRAQLEAAGLAIDGETHAYKAFYWRATFVAALQTYKSMYGDLYVPRSFVVPRDEPHYWPRATWGLRLGQQVHMLRTKAAADGESIPAYQRDELLKLDFVWDVMEHKWRTKFLPALTRFHQLYGHSSVPQKFIVPTQDRLDQTTAFRDWQDLPQCHGYRLGAAVNKVRRGDSFTAQIVEYFDELHALGFTFSSFDRTWNEKILPALETFYDVYGHSRVGAYFDVPQDDERWPRATWGMGLGFIVQNIRSRGDFFPQIMRDGDRLEAIEFVWNRAEVKWKQMVLPALETFVAIHRHARVPASFVVPQEAPWPRDAYDLRLGRIVALPSARNRYANYIEIDRKRLEELGFNWSVVDENGSDTDRNDASDSDSDSDSDSERP